MKKLFASLVLGGLLALPAWAARDKGSLAVCATVASVTTDGTCGPPMSSTEHAGNKVIVLDATSATDCGGGGSVTAICEWSGTALVAAGGTSFANGESIVNSTDGTFDFTRDEAGTVTITASDNNDVAALTILPGGAAAMVLGSTSATGMLLATDGTAIQLDADIEVESSNPIIDFLDSSTTTDRYVGTRIIGGGCTDTGAGTEDCDFQMLISEAGVRERRILIDADGDTVFEPDSPTTNYAANTSTVDNRVVGLMKMSTTTGVLTNGTTNAFLIMDDSPAGECTETNGTEADDSTTFRVGSNSYSYTFDSTGAENDGFDCVVTGMAGNGADSIGFWIRSSVAFASGDLDAVLDDGGTPEATVVLPAYNTANEWVWMELDLVTQCNATCAAVDGFELRATGQSPTTFNSAVLNLDSGAVWIDAGELAIGNVLVDGVLSVITGPTASATDNTLAVQTEWSDYFINYQASADAIVSIGDQSAKYAIILQALQ